MTFPPPSTRTLRPAAQSSRSARSLRTLHTGYPTIVSTTAPPPPEITRLRDLSPQQWKSGVAAWLGWLFDGLDMHLYTIVAMPFVATLLRTHQLDPAVGQHSAWIQAGFLLGWALGGAFFGRIGDRLGRSFALILTILTYAVFTGLSFFATEWWHLLIFRFLAALGIGGEWAVGASLLSETWPVRWRPWIAAVLQSAVNVGILLASLAVYLLAGFEERYVFLVGILPALLTLWIRKEVPETEAWKAAQAEAEHASPPISDLFRGDVRRITQLVLLVCAFSLTGHWALMFWCSQHLRQLPEVLTWSEGARTQFASGAMMAMMLASIAGNFLAAAIAKMIGYRRAIAGMCLAYAAIMLAAYGVERDPWTLTGFLIGMGVASGLFGLFTMYLPPLFPTLLRTTGAGFSYNIGRIAAAVGTLVFGYYAKVGDYRFALFWVALLFVPAALFAWRLPDLDDSSPASNAPASEPVD